MLAAYWLKIGTPLIATPMGPSGVGDGVESGVGVTGMRNVSCCARMTFGLSWKFGFDPLYASYWALPTPK